MILLNNLQSLQILLAGAVTTAQPQFYAGYVDLAAGALTTPAPVTGTTNSTTAVTWVAAPAASTVRQAKYLSLYNADTAAVTATVRVNDNGTFRTLAVVTLRPGETLEYADGVGFEIKTTSLSTSAISYGTYAARPAASAAPNTVYFATNVGETYISNGTTWTLLPAGGSELGYAEITSTFSTASTTAVDIAGLSVTVVVGERPIVMAYGGNLRNTNAGGYARLLAIANGVNSSNLTILGTAGFQAMSRETRISGLTPGTSYTFKLQLMAITAGTAELYADANDKPYLQVRTA